MALNSMTGFARTEGANDFCAWVWEARSVNAKGLDARLRLAPGFEALDAVVRDRVKKAFRRGNVSLSLNVKWQRGNATYQVNLENLDQLLAAMPAVHKRLPNVAPVTMDGLLNLKGVVEGVEDALGEDDQEAVQAEVLASLDKVLDDLAAGRAGEGAHIAEVLTGQVDEIETLCDRAAALAAAQPDAIKARLATRVKELVDTVPGLPEDRLAQEAAMLMLKADVREELDRLAAHRAAARKLMGQGGAIGREFDFLCQEFNREANTLCSKSADVELTQVGLALKTVIDQMREQVQNIE